MVSWKARIRKLCSIDRAGNALCAWHDSRHERRAFPPRMAPDGYLNCGCSVDEALSSRRASRGIRLAVIFLERRFASIPLFTIHSSSFYRLGMAIGTATSSGIHAQATGFRGKDQKPVNNNFSRSPQARGEIATPYKDHLPPDYWFSLILVYLDGTYYTRDARVAERMAAMSLQMVCMKPESNFFRARTRLYVPVSDGGQ
ncbi:hypothetical protein C8J57DRAFT_1518941 [Mycena rebaudengoi]|nr:hypothetical protein C8J57DRAFT_1518941 [Mycena rebaudengoi]